MKYSAIILMIFGILIWAGIGFGAIKQTKTVVNSISTASILPSSSAIVVPSPLVIYPTASIISSPSAAPIASVKVAVGPTVTPSVKAAGLTESAPMILKIPKINLTASVESIGVDSAGRMDVPRNWQNVGWYNLGFKIGDQGSAVIDGHFDTVSGKPAAFYYLSNLNIGDVITVLDSLGKTYNFKVMAKASYPWDQMPLQNIFASQGSSGLNLITCSGSWDRNNHNYTNRLVVYSKLE